MTILPDLPNIGTENAYIKVMIRPEDQRHATPGSINGMGNGDAIR
jgi:hypothetical protein